MTNPSDNLHDRFHDAITALVGLDGSETADETVDAVRALRRDRDELRAVVSELAKASSRRRSWVRSLVAEWDSAHAAECSDSEADATIEAIVDAFSRVESRLGFVRDGGPPSNVVRALDRWCTQKTEMTADMIDVVAAVDKLRGRYMEPF